MLWRKVKYTEYGELIDQPILIQWENASLAFDKYLKKRIRFVKLYKSIIKMHKSKNDRTKIASDHISLSKEEVLISMSYFLSGYVREYWDKYFSVLKNLMI